MVTIMVMVAMLMKIMGTMTEDGENKHDDDNGGRDDDDDQDIILKNSKPPVAALSSSLSFYVYYGKHGNPRQVKLRFMSRFLQHFATYTNGWHHWATNFPPTQVMYPLFPV